MRGYTKKSLTLHMTQFFQMIKRKAVKLQKDPTKKQGVGRNLQLYFSGGIYDYTFP